MSNMGSITWSNKYLSNFTFTIFHSYKFGKNLT